MLFVSENIRGVMKNRKKHVFGRLIPAGLAE